MQPLCKCKKVLMKIFQDHNIGYIWGWCACMHGSIHFSQDTIVGWDSEKKLTERKRQSSPTPYCMHFALLRRLLATHDPWHLVSGLSCSPKLRLRSQAPIPVHAVILPEQHFPSPGFRGHNPSFDQAGKAPGSVNGKGSQRQPPNCKVGCIVFTNEKWHITMITWLRQTSRPAMLVQSKSQTDSDTQTN